MRPRPPVPSSRRTLASLAALLISAALSLGFAPLSTNLVSDVASALTPGGEPCDLEKLSTTGAAVSTASPGVTTASPVSTTSPAVPAVDAAASAASAALPAVKPKLSTVKPKLSTVKPKLSTASPFGLLQSCEGVRPGAPLRTDEGALCTYNFVFTDGRHNYIGTAGHCILEGPRLRSGPLERVERTWPASPRPLANDAQGRRVGEFVYAIRSDLHDFALIRLDPGVAFSPQMCHFGGPTGVNSDLVEESVTLHYYGNGLVVGTLVPARTAIAPSMRDPNIVYAHGAVVPGDSGAGVISADGRAVGNISEAGIGLGPVVEGIATITRIGPQVAAAERMLGVNLKLVTAPLS